MRKEESGTLKLSGNNAGLTGAGSTITVNEGLLQVTHANALAPGQASTTVQRGAALEIGAALNLSAETLTISGLGLGNNGLGVLRTTAGVSTIGTGTTSITFGANLTRLGVASGTELILNGTIGTNANAVEKMGTGTLEFGGTADNGWTGALTVNEGTVRLNKTGTVRTERAVRGTVTIGDFAGTGESVVYAPTTTSLDNIAAAVVGRSGGGWTWPARPTRSLV